MGRSGGGEGETEKRSGVSFPDQAAFPLFQEEEVFRKDGVRPVEDHEGTGLTSFD